MQQVVVCDTCHKEFDDFASSKRRFCSRPCYWKWLRTQKPWNLGKAGCYHHCEDARRRKSDVLKKLYREGKRKPGKRKPFLLVSNEDKNLLQELYVEQHLSAAEVATRFKVTDTTVLRRLHQLNIIPLRPVRWQKHVKGETIPVPIQSTNSDSWVFGVPCFTCQVQARCGPNSVSLPNPSNCESLTIWLFNLEQESQKIN